MSAWGQTLPSRAAAWTVRFSQDRSFRVGKTDIGGPTTGVRTILAVPDDRQMSPFVANDCRSREVQCECAEPPEPLVSSLGSRVVSDRTGGGVHTRACAGYHPPRLTSVHCSLCHRRDCKACRPPNCSRQRGEDHAKRSGPTTVVSAVWDQNS